jgi:CelD/BcsL family acetyltransferase involved in cellulose biosynthesis
MHLEWMNADALPTIEPIWRSVTAGAGVTYFQSWSWVDNWLRSLPKGRRVRLGVIKDGGTPVGAFFLGSALKRRHGVVLSLARYVNETGDDVLDDLCIEYNSFVCAASARPHLPRILEQIPGPWDELYLSALDTTRFPGDALGSLGGRYRVEVLKTSPSYFVDLDAVRARGEYIPLVGHKTRAHLRRTYRVYEADGAITTEVAADLPTAMSIYRELVDLHQSHWTKQGFAGAFGTEYFRHFHERLIRERMASGEIQLLRVRVAERTIGCIYGFVYEGALYQYQTGMVYEEDSRDRRPGFLCNAEAIKHCATLGLHRYDFLGGTQGYKKQLATGEASLSWVRVQKPRVKFWLERHAKTLRDAWRARHEARQREPAAASPGASAEPLASDESSAPPRGD